MPSAISPSKTLPSWARWTICSFTRKIGTGVGRLLLRAGEDWFVATGADAAILWVFSDNVLARDFYERSGWTFTGHEQDEPGLKKTGFTVRECLYSKRFRV